MSSKEVFAERANDVADKKPAEIEKQRSIVEAANEKRAAELNLMQAESIAAQAKAMQDADRYWNEVIKPAKVAEAKAAAALFKMPLDQCLLSRGITLNNSPELF